MPDNRFPRPIAIGLCGFFLLSAGTTHAAVVTHSEAHVSNILVTPASGSLVWYDQWVIAAAGAFDDPSGFDQAYDDDPDADGEASASASTAYVSETAVASANAMTIDVESNVDIPGDDLVAFTAYGFGELYSVFEISGSNPTDVAFSMDYSATLAGESTDPLFGFNIDYGIQMVISDGVSDWVLGAAHVLSGSGTTGPVSHVDSGTLAGIFELQPFTLYSLDIIVDPNSEPIVVPIPGAAILFASALAFFVPWCRGRKRDRGWT